MKYDNGFGLLCFVVVALSFMDQLAFTHNLQGGFIYVREDGDSNV